MRATQNASHLLKTSLKVLHLSHNTILGYSWHVVKHVALSQRLRLPPTRKQVAQRLKPSKFKSDHSCSILHRHSHRDLTRTAANSREQSRTVANACERLHNVYRTHRQPPNPQNPKRCYIGTMRINEPFFQKNELGTLAKRDFLLSKTFKKMYSKIGPFRALPQKQLIFIGAFRWMLKTSLFFSEDAFQGFNCLLLQVGIGVDIPPLPTLGVEQ